MQIPGMLQTVTILMIVVIAASCSATKEYTSKLFKPAGPAAVDTQAVALRFLNLEDIEEDQENWVTTDIIKGKDTSNQSLELDRLAKTIPALPDSTLLPKSEPRPIESAPVARQAKPGEVRTKKTRE